MGKINDVLVKSIVNTNNDITTLSGVVTNFIENYEVIDNLTSDETEKPLSAAQGKKLKGLIDSISEETVETFKYYKIVFDEVYRNGALTTQGLSVVELAYYNSDGEDVSIQSGCKYSADSEYRSDFAVGYAFDRNDSTRWGSNNNYAYVPHYIIVELPNTESVVKVGIKSPDNFEVLGKIVKFTVYASNDNLSWEFIKSYDNLTEGWTGITWREFELPQKTIQGLQDAPKDGQRYVRCNGSWVVEESVDMELMDSYPKPHNIITVKFVTEDPIPTTKDEENPILAHGNVEVNIDGNMIKKYATIEVQGKSSANKPKKNFTFAFYNDSEESESYSFQLGGMVAHSEYVYKANYIDPTQVRNVGANRLWDQMCFAKKKHPFRGSEGVYDIETGALCHVDGYPCVVYINNQFYGIGSWTIGKKNVNYDMTKTTQTQIQMQAEPRTNMVTYNSTQWEIRNPKTPDDQFATRIAPWFTDNAKNGDSFKNDFTNHHNLENMIDYFLFAEFLYAEDILDNNMMLTTWDCNEFFLLPYDLDTIFGLYYDGGGINPSNKGSVVYATLPNKSNPSGAITKLSTQDYWIKFKTAFLEEIKSRYTELKQLNIFSVSNICKIINELEQPYGLTLFNMEKTKWGSSGTFAITNKKQILDWVKGRIEWMDSYYFPITLTALDINGPDNVYGEAQYTPIYTPEDTNERYVTWSIINGTEYASINNDGKLTVFGGADKNNVTIQLASTIHTDIIATKTITVSNSAEYDYHYEVPSLDGSTAQLVDTGLKLFSDEMPTWSLFIEHQDMQTGTSKNSTIIACVDESASPYSGFRADNPYSGTNENYKGVPILKINRSGLFKWYDGNTGTVASTTSTAPSVLRGHKLPYIISRNGSELSISFNGTDWEVVDSAFTPTTTLKTRSLIIGGELDKYGEPFTTRYAKTDSPVEIAFMNGKYQESFDELMEKYSTTE